MNKVLLSLKNELQTELICNSLRTRMLGRELWCFNSIESTNLLLKKIQPQYTREGLVCVAAHQYGGRGQHEKKWITEKGNALTFSFVLKPVHTDSLQLLLQACALGVLNVLKNNYSVHAVLKWPNDVLVGGKKICGILAEGTFLGSKMERFVVGLGLNTNGRLSALVEDVATNLEIILGEPIDKTHLFCQLLHEIEQQYSRWAERVPELITEINRHHRGYGKWNTVQLSNEKVDGFYKFLGLDLQGFPIFLNESDGVNRITRSDIRFEPID